MKRIYWDLLIIFKWNILWLWFLDKCCFFWAFPFLARFLFSAQIQTKFNLPSILQPGNAPSIRSVFFSILYFRFMTHFALFMLFRLRFWSFSLCFCLFSRHHSRFSLVSCWSHRIALIVTTMNSARSLLGFDWKS